MSNEKKQKASTDLKFFFDLSPAPQFSIVLKSIKKFLLVPSIIKLARMTLEMAHSEMLDKQH